jgi:hypothetical protein
MPHNGGSKIVTCAADGQVCDTIKITSLVVTKASAGLPVLGVVRGGRPAVVVGVWVWRGGMGVVGGGQSRSVDKPASASAPAFFLCVS